MILHKNEYCVYTCVQMVKGFEAEYGQFVTYLPFCDRVRIARSNKSKILGQVWTQIGGWEYVAIQGTLPPSEGYL